MILEELIFEYQEMLNDFDVIGIDITKKLLISKIAEITEVLQEENKMDKKILLILGMLKRKFMNTIMKKEQKLFDKADIILLCFEVEEQFKNDIKYFEADKSEQIDFLLLEFLDQISYIDENDPKRNQKMTNILNDITLTRITEFFEILNVSYITNIISRFILRLNSLKDSRIENLHICVERFVNRICNENRTAKIYKNNSRKLKLSPNRVAK